MTPMENNELQQACQTPFEDMKKEALEHYEEISTKACHWNSLVPKAIMAYDPDHESKFKAFLEWLNEEIKRLDECEKNKNFETSYIDILNRGSLHQMKTAKEKFIELTLTPPPITKDK